MSENLDTLQSTINEQHMWVSVKEMLIWSVYHILPVVITYQYLLMNALLAMKLTPNMGVVFFKYII